MTGLRHVIKAICLVLALSLIAGCSPVSTAPAASIETAEAFLKARAAGDAPTLHRLLTDTAQKSIARAELIRFLAAESFSYGTLGAPVVRESGWVQIPVSRVRITQLEREITWSEYRITMYHDGRQWRVAWAEPLFDLSLLAYARNAFDEQLRLGVLINEIDPYHYRGYLEQHFSYRGLVRLKEAEVWLSRATDYATGPQRPDVLDATARFLLSIGAAAEAKAAAEQSLQSASAHVPTTYSRRWQADTMVVLARAQLALGDWEGANATVSQALFIDPENGPLAVFQMELKAPVLVAPVPQSQPPQPARP